jgi:hypothetical protein
VRNFEAYNANDGVVVMVARYEVSSLLEGSVSREGGYYKDSKGGWRIHVLMV